MGFFLKTLDLTERQRASRFVLAENRDQYIVNHGVLRYLLSGYTGCRPKEIAFSRNDFGKPYLIKGVAEHLIDFNLSDSGQFGMVAVGRGLPVGVDIELMRPIADRNLLVQEVFSGEEFRLLNGIEEEYIEEVFFFCWTRKEALIKAIGTGLSTSLKEFSTIPHYRPIHYGDEKKITITSSDIDWKITSSWAARGYLSALATRKDVIRVDYFDLSAVDLLSVDP